MMTSQPRLFAVAGIFCLALFGGRGSIRLWAVELVVVVFAVHAAALKN